MPSTEIEIRRGAYYDSVVLMQLQAALVKLPDVLDAGVIMGTPANKELLEQTGLRVAGVEEAVPDDLIIVVKCDHAEAARTALAQVDTLLAQRRSTVAEQEYLPQSLEAAAEMLPDAQWVLISVPGRYAAGVARESLRLGKNAFLYSDNVSLEDEIALKQEAAHKGLLVMGPDCGTAIVNGIGLGFANRVRSGPIGVVGASGTGLQQVTARIHQLGSGVTHALGTGGRDLSESVGAVTMIQSLDLLTRDPDTEVIVLISKPPSPQVARQLLDRAQASGKPVVVDFIGYTPSQMRDGNLHYAPSLDATAELAVSLVNGSDDHSSHAENHQPPFAESQKYLRGLFSGGTLAYEALLILQDVIPGIYSNVPLDKKYKLENALHSREHSIIDLGEDEFTVGRLHPMLDHTLRIQRLMQEANDPETAVILLDVVLGYGAHPDPAGELAPAIQKARERAVGAGRHLEVVAVVVGTDEDPQNMAGQIETLEAVGAVVVTSNEDAARLAGNLTPSVGDGKARRTPAQPAAEVNLNIIKSPLVAINVGLESFTESLQAQEAGVVHVNWRPPAGGNERLMGILERMKSKG